MEVIRQEFLQVRCPFQQNPSTIGAKKSTQTFFVQSFSKTLRVLDVRAQNRGRPHQKDASFCGPGDGEKLFDPGSSGRKGSGMSAGNPDQKVYVYAVFFSPD